MSTGSESASSVGSVMHDHHQVRRGSLQRKVGDSVNAATKRLLHTPGGTGRDSAGSARSDGGTRRPKIVDVFMFPALTMDEYFRSAVSLISNICSDIFVCNLNFVRRISHMKCCPDWCYWHCWTACGVRRAVLLRRLGCP